MRRRAALYAPGVALVAVAWLHIEQPRADPWPTVVLALLALAPALARPAWLRAPVLVASLLAAVNVAFAHAALGTATLAGAPWLPPGLPAGLASGVLSFYDVTLPFDAGAQPLMHAVVLFAVYAFALTLAMLLVAGRPVAAALAVVVGVTWPATLDPGSADLVLGVLVLAFVLVLLVATRPGAAGRPSAAVLAGAAACTLAAVCAASPAVARSGLLAWERWDPYTPSDAGVSVEYVWRSSYGGIHFPKRATTVFTVRTRRRPLYWRATTLPVFDGRGWVEALQSVPALRAHGVDVPRQANVPAHPRDAVLVRQQVTVSALRDDHLVAASIPVAYSVPEPTTVAYATDGTALARFAVGSGETYTAWSLVASPSARELSRSPARYPRGIAPRFLAVARGVDAPPFGAAHRRARVAALLRTHRDDARVGPYAPLYAAALRVAGGARSPYGAAVSLEAWFRLGGGFRYDEQPPPSRGAQPLVDFVVRTHRGYCQHYAGAMTLMLRYLGVPARVAAGFTSGSYDARRHEWVVMDRDAHTWVEVWFAGYGWLPFDPTPSRGGLGGSYSSSSGRFDAAGALGAIGGRAFGVQALHGALASGGPGAPRARRQVSPSEGRGAAVWALLALAGLVAAALAAVATLGLAKRLARRRRLAAHEPRLLARGCRRELEAYLADQRVAVPSSATNAELAALFEAALDVPAKGLAAALDAARFGSASAAPAGAARLRVELPSVLQALAEAVPRGRRLRGLVSLRSLRLAG